jgi:hypothetical protein
VGTVLSALGLALVVFGVLRSGTWGLITPKPNAPELLGLSPVIWLIFLGGCVLAGFLAWERRRLDRGQAVLLDPAMLDNKLLRGGLVSFFFQYLLQAGLFFAVPLFLSVALGLSAIATGVQLLPLSITLLLAAAGVPKLFPNASPRRVVRIGFLSLFASLVILIALLDLGAGPEIITWPMLLAGLGIGALASQLGAITVSAVPDEQSGEVGGLQNTDLSAHRILHRGHPRQSRHPRRGQVKRASRTGERHSLHLRHRPAQSTRGCRGASCRG